MDRNQPITRYKRDLLNPLKKAMFLERSVIVSKKARNVNGRLLLQNAAIVTKKIAGR